MNVKRYQVKDMQEAMDQIRRELGSDAIVLSSRPVRKKGIAGLFSPKMLEVMVAYDPPQPKPARRPAAYDPPQPKPAPETPLPDAPMKNPTALPRAVQRYLGEDAAGIAGMARAEGPAAQARPAAPEANREDINARLDGLTHMLHSLTGRMDRMQRTGENFSPEIQELYTRLTEQEVSEDLALSLASQTQRLVEKNGGADAKSVMSELIRQCIGETVPLRVKPFKRGVVLMLGPTGVGKTTSLIKLAVYYQTKYDLKVGLINADTFRVAANEQLKIYADILGAQMSVIYSPDEMESVLKEHEDKDLVFIDTAGKKPTDERHKQEIEEYIRRSGAGDVYLVMSGSTGYKACASIIENYAFVRDYKLLVTKMDETPTQSIILNVCSLSGRPLSYIAAGQNVPNDIALADPETIAAQILDQGDA